MISVSPSVLVTRKTTDGDVAIKSSAIIPLEPFLYDLHV